MAKKLKKAKKTGLSPRTRSIIGNSFKGIISNQACIDNGKEAPWWLAVLFLLFAVLIPLIPNHVNMNNAYGSSFLNSGTFEMDRGLAKASLTLKKENKTFKIEGGHLHYYEGENEKTPTALDPDMDLYKDVATNGAKTEYKFMLYLTGRTGKSLNAYVKEKTSAKYVIGTTEIYNAEIEEHKAAGAYTPTFVILTPNTLAAATFKAGSTKMVASTFGGLNWVSSKKGDLLDRMIYPVTKILDADKNPVYGSTVEEVVNNIDVDYLRSDAKSKIYNQWKAVFNETYLQQKNVTKWNTTLIYLGVYAGLMFFLGLMVFLLTRGKNNPFRVLNFWVCQKIAYFLSFTPAVLALIVGFIFAGNMIGQMAFIMLLSLRIMWASMRQLRPVY